MLGKLLFADIAPGKDLEDLFMTIMQQPGAYAGSPIRTDETHRPLARHDIHQNPTHEPLSPRPAVLLVGEVQVYGAAAGIQRVFESLPVRQDHLYWSARYEILNLAAIAKGEFAKPCPSIVVIDKAHSPSEAFFKAHVETAQLRG